MQRYWNCLTRPAMTTLEIVSAHSPIPPTAFMLLRVATKKIGSRASYFQHVLADIETLNRSKAMEGFYHLAAIFLSRLSYVLINIVLMGRAGGDGTGRDRGAASDGAGGKSRASGLMFRERCDGLLA